MLDGDRSQHQALHSCKGGCQDLGLLTPWHLAAPPPNPSLAELGAHISSTEAEQSRAAPMPAEGSSQMAAPVLGAEGWCCLGSAVCQGWHGAALLRHRGWSAAFRGAVSSGCSE